MKFSWHRWGRTWGALVVVGLVSGCGTADEVERTLDFQALHDQAIWYGESKTADGTTIDELQPQFDGDSGTVRLTGLETHRVYRGVYPLRLHPEQNPMAVSGRVTANAPLGFEIYLHQGNDFRLAYDGRVDPRDPEGTAWEVPLDQYDSDLILLILSFSIASDGSGEHPLTVEWLELKTHPAD